MVSPSLPAPKLALLANFNVVWLKMTGEEFCDQVLSQMGEAATEGLKWILSKSGASKEAKLIPDVSQIAVNPREGSEYLLGA